jgi:hypothetical protein
VTATVSSTDHTTPSTGDFPVVKESGTWKICFTDALKQLPSSLNSLSPSLPASSGSASQSLPIAVPTLNVPSIAIPTIPALPSGLTNPCGFATSASTTAITYVGLAEIGQTDYAQSCVYHNSVPRSVTAGLKVSGSGLYSPTGDSNGSKIKFTSIDGKSTIEVTATKQSDGKFYITKVEKS